MDIYVYVIILVGQLGRVKSIIVKYLGRYFHRTSTKSKKSIISNEKVGYKSLDVESGKKIGMTMLGDPYVFEAMDERMGIVTLNTPNLFDVNYSTEDTKEMCAWSLLMSSTLLYNLSGEINSNDFDQLQMFTEYAITLKEEVEEKSLRMSNASPQNLVKRVEETRKFLLDTIEKQKDEVEKEENNIQKIFKDITLLVSDWVNEEEYEYGWEGGEKYLRKQLGNKKWLHENFVSVRCFLMPRITENIMSTESNDGSLSPERKVFDMFAADIYNMKNISTIQKTADSTGKYWLEYSNTMFTVVNEKIFTSKIKTSRQEVEKDTLNWIEQQLEKDFDFCSMHDVDAVITTRINDIIAGKEILCKLSFDKQAEIFNSVMVEVN
uniref:atlastin-2-like isoform X1 n=1 Tax=Styela clava TaxID=7725 RepID=UPI00193AD3A8|nr:atlastin-2-like isoform X1 [Styela clava]